MQRPLDIAIAGAGIAGLATALYMHRLGHRPVIFERFQKPHPVGSGLILQPTGQAVLHDLGLFQPIAALGAPLDGLGGCDSYSGRVVLEVNYGQGPDAARGLGVHRAALFNVLYEAVQATGVELITDQLVAGRSGQTLLVQGNRKHGPFDLMVDATGSGSIMRPHEKLGPEPKALPFGAFWATTKWVDEGFDPRRLQQRYRRASIMAGVLPIGRTIAQGSDLAAIFWSVRMRDSARIYADGLPAFKDEVLSIWPEMAPHLSAIADWRDMTLAAYGHHTIPTAAGEGIVLVGDAAHSTSPQLGQGANMALLDAKALEVALRDETTVADALARYVALRRSHVRLYQWLSHRLTPFYQSDSHLLPALRDFLMASTARVPPAPHILRGMVSGELLNPLKRLGLKQAPPLLKGPITDQRGISGHT